MFICLLIIACDIVIDVSKVLWSHFRSYTSEDGEVLIPIGVGVCGNVVITLHHIRAIPIVKMSGRVSTK